jgi:GT2 family glycosyltransferase
MLTELPFISIIIPVNQAESLKATIDGLAIQTKYALIKEILIVGYQESKDYPALANLSYIQVDDSPTPAHNRNIGAKAANGEWLVFTDSDCVPKDNWIETLVDAMSPMDSVLAGAVDVPEKMPYWGSCDHYFGFATTAYRFANHPTIPYAPTLNFAIRRSFFNDLGGFNELFLNAGGEDREFCWRISQRRIPIRFVSQAVVVHNHPRKNFSSAVRHIYHYGLVTGQFRSIYRKQWSVPRRMGLKVAQIPIIGDLIGFIRVILRGLIRLGNQAYLQKLRYLPGIMILDFSFTLGMIRALRRRYS